MKFVIVFVDCECNTPFRNRHMSHEICHILMMSERTHLRCDLFDFDCWMKAFCASFHSSATNPRKNADQPMLDCFPIALEMMFEEESLYGIGVRCSLHAWRWSMIISVIVGAVEFLCNHCRRLDNALFHAAFESGCGHCKMCVVSSPSNPQIGHF